MSQIRRTVNFTRLVENSNFRFLESMEDLVRIRNKHGEILFENKAMRDTLKKTIHYDDTTINSSKYFKNVYDENNSPFIDEAKIDNKLYSIKASPIYDDNDVVLGFIEVYRDITVERNITMELFEAHQKINNEMILARSIQKSILPKKNNFGCVTFQYGHEPSDNLSGDVFDVIEISKDKIGVYIADVVGHGISASIMTMFIRQSMLSILQEYPNYTVSKMIKELKLRYAELGLDVSQYFTILFMLIDKKEKCISYVNAGHNCFPILFDDNKLEILENKGKIISNLFDDVEYEEKKIKLVKGDRILIYTDGLTETINSSGEFFGEERLMEWIKLNKNNNSFVYDLLNEVRNFRWMDQKDDVAILYLEMGV